jgi:hypothetical protein
VPRRTCYWSLSWTSTVYFTARSSLIQYCHSALSSPQFYLLFWSCYWLPYASRMPFFRADYIDHIFHMFSLIILRQEWKLWRYSFVHFFCHPVFSLASKYLLHSTVYLYRYRSHPCK